MRELSIMNATAPFEICISGGGCALAALNYVWVSAPAANNSIGRVGSSHLFVGNAVRHKTAFEADAAGLKFVRAPGVFAVDEAHELGCAVTVVVGRAVGWMG